MMRFIVTLLVLTALLCPGSGHGEPAPAGPVVASVVAIDGKLSVKRSGSSTWTAAKLNMSDYLHDRLKTDTKSMAGLEFVVGGKIALSHSTEVELMGTRKAEEVGSGTELQLTSGSLWATMTPQKNTFSIKTPSCTIGIRGTEFVVDEDSDGTQVSVLSGEVAVTDATNQETLARPGHVLRVRRGQRPVVRVVELSTLRGQLQQRHGRLGKFLDRLRPRALPSREPARRPRRPLGGPR